MGTDRAPGRRAGDHAESQAGRRQCSGSAGRGQAQRTAEGQEPRQTNTDCCHPEAEWRETGLGGRGARLGVWTHPTRENRENGAEKYLKKWRPKYAQRIPALRLGEAGAGGGHHAQGRGHPWLPRFADTNGAGDKDRRGGHLQTTGNCRKRSYLRRPKCRECVTTYGQYEKEGLVWPQAEGPRRRCPCRPEGRSGGPGERGSAGPVSALPGPRACASPHVCPVRQHRLGPASFLHGSAPTIVFSLGEQTCADLSRVTRLGWPWSLSDTFP